MVLMLHELSFLPLQDYYWAQLTVKVEKEHEIMVVKGRNNELDFTKLNKSFLVQDWLNFQHEALKKGKEGLDECQTLGTKTRQSVAVEQKMMNMEMMTKAASCWSRKTKDNPAPMTHMITFSEKAC